MLTHTNGSQQTLEGQTSFSQLVREHHRWAKQFHGRNRIDEETRERYQTALADFEGTAGPIVDAYWCSEEASAVALTEREPRQPVADGLIGRLVRRPPEPELRLYRVTDWMTANAPPLADLLHSCDILAIKAGRGARGNRAARRHALGARGRDPCARLRGAVARNARRPQGAAGVRDVAERAELEQIEAYINSSGERVARISFVQGMLLGILPVIALGFLAAFVISLFNVLDIRDEGVRAFYGCYAAGAVGAIVSVLSRMGSKKDNFTIDHETPALGPLRCSAPIARSWAGSSASRCTSSSRPVSSRSSRGRRASPSMSPSPSSPGSANAGRASS